MKLEMLINSFLEKTGYLEDDKVLGIVVYGSRVRQTNKESSDLDVLILADFLRNYKASMVVEGIFVDYTIFSVRDLFDVAYSKKINHNAYFESVLKTGIVVKNKDDILGQLELILDELSEIRVEKKRISPKVLVKIRELYNEFLRTQNVGVYYFLLEMLRTSYNTKNGCSYLSMVKVYDVFTNKNFYEDVYHIQLPDDRFISLFLEGVIASDFDLRVEILSSLFEMMAINLDVEDDFSQEEFFFVSSDDIKRELVILHNKLLKVIEFLRENHPYAEYVYSVTLRQLGNFYKRVYGVENEDILRVMESSLEKSNEEKIQIIKRIFGIVEKDYRFDYGNYMLKLEL